jgi:hypothetical protein
MKNFIKGYRNVDWKDSVKLAELLATATNGIEP